MGLTAICLWSMIVALIKEVSRDFGPIGGAALIYSLASILLFLSFGWTRIKDFSITYLIWGSILFVAYELCMALSIGYTHNNKQAIEVGMVNYLWPTLTILFSNFFNQQKSNLLIIPGICLSMFGICWVLGGEYGLSINAVMLNIYANPLSYGLAFLGAILWATYCTVTARSANGKNGITLFFVMVSIILWIKWMLIGDSFPPLELNSLIYVVGAAFAMGMGYGAWNIGIMYGNVTLLAVASYFTPVLSSLISAVFLNTYLGFSFWQGTCMVSLGALLCWISTRKKTK